MYEYYLCTCVSLIWLWTLRWEGLPLPAFAFGAENGNPLQYSCLENPMDKGVWRAIVHGVTKGQTQLSDWAHTHASAFLFHPLPICFILSLLLFIFSSLFPFLPLFLLPSRVLHLKKSYYLLVSLIIFSFNVAKPEFRLIADQLQKHPRYAVQ